MSTNNNYLNYLQNRSFISLLYRRFWLYPKISKFLNEEVLDVGCGIGDFLKYYKQSVGVDINPEIVKYCNSQGLNVFLMEQDVLPFPSFSFSSIILDNVLEHIAFPNYLLSEINRVLRKNGVLVIGVPGECGYRYDTDHKVFYNEDRLKKTLSKFGFHEKTNFYAPFKSIWLDKNARQYCLYSVFEKA